MQNKIASLLILCSLISLNTKAKEFLHFHDFKLLKTVDTSISKIMIYNITRKDSLLCNIVKYDAFGRLSTITTLNEDSKTIKEVVVRKYFKNTDILENTTSTTYDKKSSGVVVNAFEYDSLFRTKFEFEFDKDTANVSIKHFYYLNDRLFKIEYKPDNTSGFYPRSLFYYDPKGRLIKQDNYNSKKQLIYSKENEYVGDVVKTYLVNKNGRILENETEYKNNRLIKEYATEDINTIEGNDFNLKITHFAKTIEYFYDDSGRLKEVVYTFHNGNTKDSIPFYISTSDDVFKLSFKYFYK